MCVDCFRCGNGRLTGDEFRLSCGARERDDEHCVSFEAESIGWLVLERLSYYL
jgi:hypothetical protein